jgi:ribosomal protein L34E
MIGEELRHNSKTKKLYGGSYCEECLKVVQQKILKISFSTKQIQAPII